MAQKAHNGISHLSSAFYPELKGQSVFCSMLFASSISVLLKSTLAFRSLESLKVKTMCFLFLLIFKTAYWLSPYEKFNSVLVVYPLSMENICLSNTYTYTHTQSEEAGFTYLQRIISMKVM